MIDCTESTQKTLVVYCCYISRFTASPTVIKMRAVYYTTFSKILTGASILWSANNVLAAFVLKKYLPYVESW